GCAAPAARAECGDYLHHPGTTTPAASSPAPQKPPAPPCRGPGCSNHSAPLLPAPSVAPAPGPQEALLAVFHDDNPADVARACFGHSPLLLSGLPLDVFHPPRLA